MKSTTEIKTALEAATIPCKLVKELPDVTGKIYVLPVETKDRLEKKKVVYEEWMFQKHKLGYFTGLKEDLKNEQEGREE